MEIGHNDGLDPPGPVAVGCGLSVDCRRSSAAGPYVSRHRSALDHGADAMGQCVDCERFGDHLHAGIEHAHAERGICRAAWLHGRPLAPTRTSPLAALAAQPIRPKMSRARACTIMEAKCRAVWASNWKRSGLFPQQSPDWRQRSCKTTAVSPLRVTGHQRGTPRSAAPRARLTQNAVTTRTLPRSQPRPRRSIQPRPAP